MPGSVFSPYTSITTNILFFDRTGPTKETWFYRLDMPEGYKHFSKTKPMKPEHFAPAVSWWNNWRELVVDGFDKAKKFTVQQLTEDFGFDLNQCGYPQEEKEILSPLDLIQHYKTERAALNAAVDKAVLNIQATLSNKKICNKISYTDGVLRRLVEIDSQFADNMRKSILQLAIQGKLVEQRSEEETAEELYQRIQEEKQQLIKAGIIKKKKPSPEIEDDEKPFDIPESWKWVHLSQIAESSLGKTLYKVKNTGELKPYLCSINVYWNGINMETVKEARFEESELAKYLLKKGDLLICEGGDVGRSAVWENDIPMYYQNALHRVRFYCGVSPHFYKFLIECYKGIGIIDSFSKGVTIKHLVQSSLNAIWFPFPPLDEQKRIVAKLEEFLPLCERLK